MTLKQPNVLVCDDDEISLRLMQALLVPQGYAVTTAHDGNESLQKASEISPDVILLDIMMPHLDGLEVARRLRASEQTRGIPIVMVTALQSVGDRVKALEAGADDCLSKPVDSAELRGKVSSLIKVKAYNDHMLGYQQELQTEVALKTQELQTALDRVQRTLEAAVEAMAAIVETRDPYTSGHQKRVTKLALQIGREMGLSEETLSAVRTGGTLHDIGKMYVPSEVLTRPGKLTDIEFMMIKTHPQVGYNIIKKLGFAPAVADMVLQHHERLDGSGYPNGLRGNDILLEAKILAVADVVEAMSSHRPYRPALATDKWAEEITANRGVLYDAAVVDACLKIHADVGIDFD